MGKIIRVFILCALNLTLQLSSPDGLEAYEGEDIEISDSVSLAELGSQMNIWADRSWHYSLDMLGIEEMEFNGIFTYDGNESAWLFQTEPQIRKVDHNGPSGDELKKGDVIVAIDDMLITTRKAGIHFANLAAGKPVELEIRRGGKRRAVTVIPVTVPELEVPIEFTVRCTDQLNRENAVDIEFGKALSQEFANSLEKSRKREAELRAATDSMGVLMSAEFSDRAPHGWIGFGLSFSGGIRRNDQGKPADWLFLELPSIKSVQPGGPADEAGLKAGDVLLKIDGLELDSPKGGERFSRMEPGQVIEWKVRRGDQTLTVETEAIEHPRR